MARVVRRRWQSEAASGLSRRDRRSCDYDAYVPDPLNGRVFSFNGDVVADVAEAETAIAQLNAAGAALVNTEALARILLRAESVASSRIEGLEIGPRRLLRAEAAHAAGAAANDITAVEVIGNIEAMSYAAEQIPPGGTLTVDHLLHVHQRLLDNTTLARHAGRFRTEQNWIGGSDYNPCSADFVPPPPEEIEDLIQDLVDFCNDDTLPAVAQAAVAHAQFETLHPFADGNGRTGRALVHIILRRRGVADRVLPPVSLILATWSKDYVEGLKATQYVGPPSSTEAVDGLNLWVGRFAAACSRAVDDAWAFEQNAEAIEDSWRDRLGPVRSGSATDRLLQRLCGAPVLSVHAATYLTGRSYVQTNQAIARLVDADILQTVTAGKRNRVFEAGDIIQAITDLERRLASPGGDTRISPPNRPAPYRRRSS